MDAREYLHQAYRLDQEIDSNMRELERWRELSVSISSPPFGERIPSARNNTDAAFVRCLEAIEEMEAEINERVNLLVALRKQIRETIDSVINADKRMILRYRYLHDMNWSQIGNELHIDRTTARRWHDEALEEVILPKDPITL